MRYLIFILLFVGCSSSTKNNERVSVTIIEEDGSDLQCKKKTTTAECYCPEKKDATVISAVGSVIGNLVSTIWD